MKDEASGCTDPFCEDGFIDMHDGQGHSLCDHPSHVEGEPSVDVGHGCTCTPEEMPDGSFLPSGCDFCDAQETCKCGDSTRQAVFVHGRDRCWTAPLDTVKDEVKAAVVSSAGDGDHRADVDEALEVLRNMDEDTYELGDLVARLEEWATKARPVPSQETPA